MKEIIIISLVIIAILVIVLVVKKERYDIVRAPQSYGRTTAYAPGNYQTDYSVFDGSYPIHEKVYQKPCSSCQNYYSGGGNGGNCTCGYDKSWITYANWHGKP